ncbi:alpha-(1-_3)-arabinofuranosyltransferase domain-containing protein [Streptomyces indicus]|uniref:Arabinofuranan 3-O-arabinosyltransferase n=1 Tax=Streptomyces indicus TaxID=417292 RepID=A0A1G9D4N8_9ACTN|nr:alpha-(1->3)-arabinofuranosyltransferase family protein [Streptomyces indicus]SDK58872.1 arabinofuranan 3-O-arabinosyltransferase [Streptomyces indicus]
MTSTVQSPQLPPQAPAPTAPPASGPPEGPRSRRWLLGFWAVVFVLFLAAAPGRMTFDTKLGVNVDPWKFFSDLGQLWHDRAGFGGIFDQYIGYAFPQLPFYGIADLLQLPVWLTERLWMSLIVATAFWGALRLAERLGIGSSRSRLLGAAVYALWPTYTIVVGSTSAAALPGAVLPWVLLPLTNDRVSARLAALRSAAVIPFMGGVNAASVLASLLPVGLYLLSRPNGPRKRAMILWWVPGVLLATAWWVVPLLLLGIHGENFLPYVETSEATTATMSGTEVLRGAGNWVAYLNFGDPWLPAGWDVTASVLLIICSALAAGLGLAGLARRDLPERRWLVLTVLSVVLITMAGYGGAFGAPFHTTMQSWLDGWLVPFRNIYKFQTGLALALVFGLMHVVGIAAVARGARPVRGRRLAPAIAAVLVIPGLLLPYLNGNVLQPGSFRELPKYWQTTADWLEKYSPDSRALVVPATAHGIYTWGSPIDQPLDVLAESRWAQRDYVPFGTAGNRRAMDAVEQALMTGSRVPGLQDFLSRAGLHYIVVRNDLDPDQVGYVPTATVKRTLEESGYERVTGFGPQTTGGRIADDTPIQVEGLYPRTRAVEIYQPSQDTERPKQAGLKPAANTAVVSGGPEALLPLSADPAMRDRPTVLTGDNHPGVGSPGLQAVGDGLRRADTRFGLINNNTSYTYTKDERNHAESLQEPGKKPRQILPTEGVEHQTTAVLRGAKEVTASTSGNWFFYLPQYDPVNAFDGDASTAWAEGSSGAPEGEWLRIAFDGEQSVPSELKVTPLAQNGVRPAPTRVKVETDGGKAVESTLQPDGSEQTVKAPAGSASWLKITILDVEEARPGLSGAGFSEVSIPGVQVDRMLQLPEDAKNAQASATTYTLHRSSDPGGLSPLSAEAGFNRQFDVTSAGDYALKASAVAVPGDAYDKLLYEVAPEQEQQVRASADSTAQLGRGLSPRNLTDGDLTTAWIAGDSAVIHLRWPDKKPVDQIVFAAAGGLSTRPVKAEISSPDGSIITDIDANGSARFAPITTDRLDITITETAPLTAFNPLADEKLQLPVGLTEVYVPALETYRTKQPDPERRFELACGKGPELTIDGTKVDTAAKGTVQDLMERRPIEVTLCGGEETVQLGTGTHRVQAADEGALALTDIALTRGTVAEPATDQGSLTVNDWAGDRRSVTVESGAASYLTMYENFNDGWKATLDGKELSPVRLDGWQQGFLVPDGASGTISLEFEPAQIYEIGLIAGAVAVLLLVLALVLWRRDTNEDGAVPVPPDAGLVLGTVVLTLVGIVIAGPFALLVPVLALLARWRHALLVPLAFVAMAGAGIAASVGAGQAAVADEGAFSPAAQLLALIALFAALVSVGTEGMRRQAEARMGAGTDPGTVPDPYGGYPSGSSRTTLPLGTPPAPYAAGPTLSARGPGPHPEPDEERPTFRLPRRRRGAKAAGAAGAAGVAGGAAASEAAGSPEAGTAEEKETAWPLDLEKPAPPPASSDDSVFEPPPARAGDPAGAEVPPAQETPAYGTGPGPDLVVRPLPTGEAPPADAPPADTPPAGAGPADTPPAGPDEDIQDTRPDDPRETRDAPPPPDADRPEDR